MQKWALILASLDDLVLNNYNRRFETYLILGWEASLIREYLDKKENALQIASFNTPIVTFTASSRRNRFYDIYDRPSLLNKDVTWQSVIPMLSALRNTFDIFIISARPVTQKEITLEMMKKFGFPLEYLTIYFKEPNEILANYRARCVDQIQQHHPEGIAVIVLPNDVIMFDRIGYHSIAFTSLRDIKEFRGITSAVCDDWVSLTQTIINLGPSDATVKISPILLSEIKPSKTDQRIGSLIEKRSPSTVEGIKNTQSMLDQAVFHQLFLGNGKIMGASEEDSVEIPYVEELLSCFMLDLKKQLPYIQRRQLNEFFGFFETKFLLKFQDVKEISQINLENMAGLPDQGITAIYLVLTKFVEAVRDQAFFIWGQARLREIYQKLTKKSIDGVIADRIRRLTLSSSKELTLLFNVSFIAWLASKYPENPYSSEISDHVGPLLEQLANRVFLAK